MIIRAIWLFLCNLLFVGVPIVRALLVGVYIGAPDCLAIPQGCTSH